MKDMHKKVINIKDRVVFTKKLSLQIFFAEVIGFTKQRVKIKIESGRITHKAPHNIAIIKII